MFLGEKGVSGRPCGRLLKTAKLCGDIFHILVLCVTKSRCTNQQPLFLSYALEWLNKRPKRWRIHWSQSPKIQKKDSIRIAIIAPSIASCSRSLRPLATKIKHLDGPVTCFFLFCFGWNSKKTLSGFFALMTLPTQARHIVLCMPYITRAPIKSIQASLPNSAHSAPS